MARIPQNVRIDYQKKEKSVRNLIKDKILFHEYFKYNYSNIEDHRINIRSIVDYLRVQIRFFEYAAKVFEFDFMSHLPSDAKLELIQYGFIDDFIEFLNDHQTNDESILTESSQNTYKIAVNSFFNWALEFDYISKNHVKKSIKKIKKKNKIVKSLSETESHALLELSTKGYTTINDREVRLSIKEMSYFERDYLRNNTFIMLMLYLGIRLSEVTQLNINSINFSKKELLVFRKGEEEDDVPLSKVLIDILNVFIESKSPAELESPALFTTLYRGEYKRISSRQIAKTLTKYFDMISAPGTYSPHKLRATLATKLLDEGYDIFYVAKALNHHSYQTTEVYLTENKKKKRDMLNRVSY